ncbi:hypothetical protein AB2N04_16685 [Nitratireductor sp. GISD-1A_MAKvit]|uniref:hypothetical protein n=1 Tax=Nitratireductor sp. GISD-1A_MAKvit TaxID=3234198 RepID=UPI003466355A
MAHVLSFFNRRTAYHSSDWSNQDLAELYRVEAVLIQAGFSLETERGLSDEGDPWFVYCLKDSGEVVVHFARIDGMCVAASPFVQKLLHGPDLGSVARQFVSENPTALLPLTESHREDVRLHPASLLTIFVASILVMDMRSGNAQAASEMQHVSPGADIQDGVSSLSSTALVSDINRAHEQGLLLAGIALAVLYDTVAQRVSAPESLNDVKFADSLKIGKNSSAPRSEGESVTFVDLTDVVPDISALTRAKETRPQLEDDDANFMVPNVVSADLGAAQFSAVKVELQLESELVPHVAELQTKGVDSAPQPTGWSLKPAFLAASTAERTIDIPAISLGATHEWYNLSAELMGWRLVEASSQWPELIMLHGADGYESSTVVLTAGEAVDPHLLTSQQLTFDEKAKAAISYFMASDEDIVAIALESNVIALFDESDLNQNPDDLMMQSWVFSDDTEIMIIGHSHVVSEAVALVA